MESPGKKMDDGLTPSQRRAVNARGNVLVMAGAGTGKTHTLVERCLHCLCAEQPPASLEEILVVTFTEAAAAEMRRRLREQMEEKLRAAAKASANLNVPVISSAGALVEALHHLGAKKISVITPYVPALTEMVCDYIRTEGIEVHDTISLGVADNLAVGRLDPANLTELAHKIDTKGVDALVLSACVQMPSLPAIQIVQDQFDIPVLSASVATVWKTLKVLGLETVVPRAGALLAGS